MTSNICATHPIDHSSQVISFEDHGIPIPNDILKLIASFLTPADIVHFGLANRRLSILFSDMELWNSLLRKHFPDSYEKLKPTTESLSFYKHLTLIENNIKTGKYRLQTLEGHQHVVSCMMVYEDKLISSDDTIKIWDLHTEKELMTLPGDTIIHRIAIYEGKLIAASLELKVWDFHTGQELQPSQKYLDILFSKNYDGKIINFLYKTIMISDPHTGQMLQTLNGHQTLIDSLIVHDGNLISLSYDGAIKIWDMRTGQELRQFQRKELSDCAAAYEDKIILGSWSGAIEILDLHTGQQLHLLKEHQRGVSCLTAYNGKLFSGSWDSTIKIWDLHTGKLLQTLKGHQERILCLAVHDGKIISGSADCTIKIWDFIPK